MFSNHSVSNSTLLLTVTILATLVACIHLVFWHISYVGKVNANAQVMLQK